MRQRRRCMLLMGLVSFCFFTVYFPILWSIRPEDVEVWNTTRDMRLLVRPFNLTTLLSNQDACQLQPRLSSAVPLPPTGELDDDEDDAHVGDEEDLFLLVAVCSSVSNFEARKAIRETWGRQGAVLRTSTTATTTATTTSISPPATGRHQTSSTSKTPHERSQPTFRTSTTSPSSKTAISNALPSSHGAPSIATTSIGGAVNASNVNRTSAQDLILTSHANVRVIFMLGRTTNETLQRLVERESRQYGDLVQEDFLDTYNNLTLKSVMLLKWVTSNDACRRASYVMKTDDDTFVNVPRLVRHLERHGRPNLLLGCMICHARPVKNKRSKWYTPRVLFSERVYPVYLSGTGYVMSADLVPRLYDAALDTPFFHLEDVFVTGLCARRLRVRPVDYEGFTYQQRPRNACLFHFAITGHRVAPADFRAIWREMWAPNLQCDRSKIRLRDFYASKCV